MFDSQSHHSVNTKKVALSSRTNTFFQSRLTINQPDDMYEQEADAAADKVMRMPDRSAGDNLFFKPKNTNSSYIQRSPATSSLSSSPVPNLVLTSFQPRYIPSGAISRQEFDSYVQTNYHVQDVHTGTQREQETKIVRQGISTVTIPGWQRWDPGSFSDGYTNIIQGIEDMINTFGAVPTINRIIFFQQAYEPDPTGIGIAQPDVGASFGAGELTIYQGYTGTHRFPLAASRTGVTTPMEPSNPDMFIRQNIAHELGHGVAEAAMASQNLQTFRQYNAAVGWVGSPPELFDMGQQPVRDAIANNTPLPAQHKITPSRWNDPSVAEQPMTMYSVIGGPGEDFAESVTAFIYQPSALQQRSSRRFNFIQTNENTWKTQMRSMLPGIQRPQIGDFPEPARDIDVA